MLTRTVARPRGPIACGLLSGVLSLAAVDAAPVLAQQPAANAAAAANPAAPANAAAKPAAKQYLTVPLNERYAGPRGQRAVSDIRTPHDDIVKGSSPFDETKVMAYYGQYVIPLLTDYRDASRMNEAQNIVRTSLAMAQRKTVESGGLEKYNAFLHNRILRVLADPQRNFHPIVQVNAYLLMGELLSKPGGRTPPEPYRAVFEDLLKAATTSTNEGVRAAALVGLRRQIELTVAPASDATSRIADQLLVAARAPRPLERGEDAHAWLVSSYLDILRSFNHNRTTETANFALDLLANEYTHPMIREAALKATGQLEPIDAPRHKFDNAGRFTMRYIKNRCEQWNDLMEISASAGGATGGYGMEEEMGGYGGGAGGYGAGYGAGPTDAYGGGGPQREEKRENPYDKQDYQTKLLRRFLHELMQDVRVGFAGQVEDIGDAPAERGLLAKMPDGQEKNLMLEILDVMRALEEELDAETIEKQSDLRKDIGAKVDLMITITEDYPGAIDEENDQTVIEPEPAPVPAEGAETPVEGADPAAAPADPSGNAAPANGAPANAPAGNQPPPANAPGNEAAAATPPATGQMAGANR